MHIVQKGKSLRRPNGLSVHVKEKEMSPITLTDFVEATSKKFNIPGAACGVCSDGKEISAFHGVTRAETPLPIDQATPFLPSSATKTVPTPTPMRLVPTGKPRSAAP